jgi:hypothetical protein
VATDLGCIPSMQGSPVDLWYWSVPAIVPVLWLVLVLLFLLVLSPHFTFIIVSNTLHLHLLLTNHIISRGNDLLKKITRNQSLLTFLPVHIRLIYPAPTPPHAVMTTFCFPSYRSSVGDDTLHHHHHHRLL